MGHLQQALELRREGNIVESTALLESILEKDGRTYFECAWNYSIQANESKAIEYYEKAIEQELSEEIRKTAYMDLALNYFAIQQYQEAEFILKKGKSEFNHAESFIAMLPIVQYKLGNSKDAMVGLMKLLLEQSMNKDITKYRKELLYYVQR